MLWYFIDRNGWLVTLNKRDMKYVYNKSQREGRDIDLTFEEWITKMEEIGCYKPTRKG